MKQRILLIEDNNEIRENTAEILELSNYTVDTAENGKAGFEKALTQKPDLIICDIMMPVLDGYGVIHLMSNNPKKRVGLIGYGLEIVENLAIEAPANKHNKKYLESKRDKEGHEILISKPKKEAKIAKVEVGKKKKKEKKDKKKVEK